MSLLLGLVVLALRVVPSQGFPDNLTFSRDFHEYQGHARRLYLNLTMGYIKELSPVYTIGGMDSPLKAPEPIPVELDLLYFRVLAVDQLQQQVTAIVMIRVDWNEPRFRWNPADFGGIEYIIMNRNAIWRPEVIPCDSSDMKDLADPDSTGVKVFYHGRVQQHLNWAVYFACDMKMEMFPFDKHQCRMCMGSNVANLDEIDFRPSDESMTRRSFGKINNEWGLVSLGVNRTSMIDNKYYNIVLFSARVMRHPIFWVNLVILPSFILGVMVITGLFLADSKDDVYTAVNFGLATMMSIMVIIGILANGLPKSEKMPVLGVYVMGQMLIISVAILIVVAHKKLYRVGFEIFTRLQKQREANASVLKSPPPLKASTEKKACQCPATQAALAVKEHLSWKNALICALSHLLRPHYILFFLVQVAHLVNFRLTMQYFDPNEYEKALRNAEMQFPLDGLQS